MSRKAPEIISAALAHIAERAVLRDTPTGERSMARTVAAFNALTGRNLTESEGWLFMIALKLARATAGGFNPDDYEDLCGYVGLLAECVEALNA